MTIFLAGVGSFWSIVANRVEYVYDFSYSTTSLTIRTKERVKQMVDL